jgi:hypothetical protein
MGDSGSWNSLHQELKMKILSHLPDEDLARFAAVDREAMGMAADVMTMKWSEWATQAIEYVQRTYNMELHQVRDIVFRGDARSPDVIFRIGFTPHPDYIDAPRPYFQDDGEATSHVVSTSRDITKVKGGYQFRGGFIYALYCKDGFDLLRRSQGNRLKEVAAMQIPPKHIIAAVGPITEASKNPEDRVSVRRKKVYVNPGNTVQRKNRLLFDQAIKLMESAIGIGKSTKDAYKSWAASTLSHYRRSEPEVRYMICLNCANSVASTEQSCPDCAGTQFLR